MSTAVTEQSVPDDHVHGSSTPIQGQVTRSGEFAGRSGRELAALAVLLIGTAVGYLIDLSKNGLGNDFYAAAVQAGTKSWKAFFFGSFDSSNFITVDKPPVSLWAMEVSGRIFGFGSWSMLAPQVLEAVIAVFVLYAGMRRWFGPAAGLIAGAVLALTPVAVLMFRFNNPDAMMTLLIVLAAYATMRAIEAGSTRWLMLSGVAFGFAFLTKSLQPFTLLPALALAFLAAAPGGIGRRLLQLAAGGLAIVGSAGWWVLAVQLTPTADRPYVGGSADNSELNLAFGYNGLGRITGNNRSGGGVTGPARAGGFGGGGRGTGGGRGGGGFGGRAGLGRLFDSSHGGLIAWLLPAALLSTFVLAVIAGRSARTDLRRAAAILFGGWLIVTGLVLSFAGGTTHTYYTIELAPAVAALVAAGAVTLWAVRGSLWARAVMVVGVVGSAAWSWVLLVRVSGWQPWLRYAIVVAAVVFATVALLRGLRGRATASVAAIAATFVLLTGPAAFAVDTVVTAHTGGSPNAGPTVSGAARGGFGGARSANPELIAELKASTTKWAAATVGAQAAEPLELGSGKAVMALGGFSGSDHSISLANFEKLAKAGQIHYFISGGNGGGRGGSSANASITKWVQGNYNATTVGTTTVYDLAT